jgi:cytochrome c peroxidase
MAAARAGLKFHHLQPISVGRTGALRGRCVVDATGGFEHFRGRVMDRYGLRAAVLPLLASAMIGVAHAESAEKKLTLPLNPADFQMWRLPSQMPFPADNKPTPARVELGKMLFFDPRLSRDSTMSCATCHNPMFGWSDGLATARGHHGLLLGRASPPVYNTGYNSIQMWDGRAKTLEDQAMGPLKADVEMNADFERVFAWLNSNPGYKQAFQKAYPGEGINETTASKAIASFERTIAGGDSRFDKWLAGDRKALSAQEQRGFAVFLDKDKGNCAVCHAAPNFTDNGFHNVGLASFGVESPDVGRYAQRKLPAMMGAFKTPSLRNVEATAPYFHDGSAKTLMDVVDHYARGGDVKTNLSPEMKALDLTQQDKEDLVAFMRALTPPHKPFVLPELPR